MNYEAWLALPKENRIAYFDSLSPYEPGELAQTIAKHFRDWALVIPGISDASLGTNHGSLELRIEWKHIPPPSSLPQDFQGLYIRHTNHYAEEEYNKK